MFDLYAGIDFYEINVSLEINDKFNGADVAVFDRTGRLDPLTRRFSF